MTIKERIMALFNKPPKPHPFVEFTPEVEISDDIKEEIKLWDSVQDGFSVEEAVEKSTRLEAKFESEFPGKHAIWRGKETIAFKKWMEELG